MNDKKVGRCNCRICQKTGYTGTSIANPEKDFTLLSPASKSELSDYPPNHKKIHHYFCDKCGVHVFGEGSYEFQGQKHDFFTVNLATVDQPQEGIDLAEFQIEYVDGLHDNWMAGKKDKPWSGGFV